MENNRYTIRDIMEISVNDLGKIPVPIELEEVAGRIRQVRNNLINCIIAIDKDAAKQQEEEAEVIEIKPEETVEETTEA